MNAENLPPPPPSSPDAGVASEEGGSFDDENMEGLPRRFGKYTLIRKLAVGGMAELFLAIQRSVAGFEKLIVIKRILPAMNQDRAFIDMFLHEARIAATLSHPSIVHVFDVGQVDGTYFIAMEHVHGEDLRSIVRQMRKKGVHEFPLEHAISIILGMCAGLAYAHEKRDLDGSALNIVHRDISPQNVVVTFSGDVKIVDFGIAKSDVKLHADTRSGRLKGKVPYMSPEQARGEVVDWRSDIFAVGVMLFELTTGKRLFKGASEYETLKLICDRDYPLPSEIRAGYPPDLEEIVMRALVKDRANRYQSAGEMQQALEEFVRRERIPVSTIALNHFMQSLFEEKLASQKEALLQGKHLADIIEAQKSEPTFEEAHPSQGILSTPAASRTVTEIKALRKRRSIALGAVGVLVVGGITAFGMIRPKIAAQASETGGTGTAGKGSIVVTTDPPGAAIWINGDLRPEVTPATVTDLPTGRPIGVKLTKDGFERASEEILLTGGEPKGTVVMTLRRGSVSVDVSCKPAGPDCAKASLTLDGKSVAGMVIDGVSSGETHTLVVSFGGSAGGASGGAATDQTFSFSGSPFERKHFDVVVDRAASDVAAASVGRHSGAHQSQTTTPAPQGGNGKLNVGASGGWCNVTVDGVARGATPVAGIDLSAGPHRVTCALSDGKVQVATVVVPADATTRYRFAL
jgi:serine/threonine protein kinase